MGLNRELLKYGPLSVIFLSLLSFSIFGISVSYDFFFLDDSFHVVYNEYSELTLSNFLAYWKTSDIPVVYNCWQLIHYFFGDFGAMPFRSFNILFHIFNGVMVFSIADKFWSIKKDQQYQSVPFILSFIFLVHPIQVESVVWISSFRSTLATFFMLASVLCFIKRKSLERGFFYELLVVGFYVLGILSKSIVVVLPLFYVGLNYFLYREKWRSFFNFYTLFPLLGLIFYSTLVLIPKGTISMGLELGPNVFLILNSILFYISKFFLPFSLSSIYGLSLEQLTFVMKGNDFVIKILIFSIIFFALTFEALRKRRILFLIGLSIFLLFIAPVSGVFGFHYQIISTVADRYAYLPIIGLTLMAVDLWSRVQGKLSQFSTKIQLNKFIAVTFAILCVLCIRQVFMWSDNLKLLEAAEKQNPESYHVQLASGLQFLNAGDKERAEIHLKKAGVLKPQSVEAQIFLMSLYSHSGKFDLADKLYTKNKIEGLAKLPFILAYSDTLMLSGRLLESQELLRNYLEIYPYNMELANRLRVTEEGNNSQILMGLKSLIQRKDLKLSDELIKTIESHIKIFESKKIDQ